MVRSPNTRFGIVHDQGLHPLKVRRTQKGNAFAMRFFCIFYSAHLTEPKIPEWLFIGWFLDIEAARFFGAFRQASRRRVQATPARSGLIHLRPMFRISPPDLRRIDPCINALQLRLD